MWLNTGVASGKRPVRVSPPRDRPGGGAHSFRGRNSQRPGPEALHLPQRARGDGAAQTAAHRRHADEHQHRRLLPKRHLSTSERLERREANPSPRRRGRGRGGRAGRTEHQRPGPRCPGAPFPHTPGELREDARRPGHRDSSGRRLAKLREETAHSTRTAEGAHRRGGNKV